MIQLEKYAGGGYSLNCWTLMAILRIFLEISNIE